MSAPRKIWAYSMDAEECTHGGWDVYQDDGYDAPQSLYHHDDVVRELVEALEKVVILGRVEGTNDKPFMKTALTDCGDIARAALAKIAQEG